MSPFHSTVNMHLGFFMRSLGRAYLAYCSPEQVEAFARQGVADRVEGYQIAADSATLCSIISTVRYRGYALRDRDLQPHSDTLSVPIFVDGTVRASIGLTYFRSAVHCEAAITSLARRLMAASAEISSRAEALMESV